MTADTCHSSNDSRRMAADTDRTAAADTDRTAAADTDRTAADDTDRMADSRKMPSNSKLSSNSTETAGIADNVGSNLAAGPEVGIREADHRRRPCYGTDVRADLHS